MFERKEGVEYYKLKGQCEQNHEDVCRKVRKPLCLKRNVCTGQQQETRLKSSIEVRLSRTLISRLKLLPFILLEIERL